jgi:phosphate transport system protein
MGTERHFDQELAGLKEVLLRMASMAEQSVALSLKALITRDDAVALGVEIDDNEIDQLQIEIDERCMKMLALRQPTARDLRFIMMATKINTDLERIADSAVNIARRAQKLNTEPLLKPLVDIPRMGEIVRGMIHDALDAFVYEKIELARRIIPVDKEVDNLDRELHQELTEIMINDPTTVNRAVNLISIAHNLERIGDHATNIAEDIVYLYEARDIRHQHEEPTVSPTP